MIWFTSDLHYGHENIISYSSRPFQSTAEMNDVLIDHINASVQKNNTLYIVGDIAMKRAQFYECLARINCTNIHLVKGNHDPENVKPGGTLKSVSDYKYVRVAEHRLVLCHYPFYEWYHKRRGVIHLHGHTHGTIEEAKLQYGRNDLSFDVGVDVLDYKPVNFDQVLEMVEERKRR